MGPDVGRRGARRRPHGGHRTGSGWTRITPDRSPPRWRGRQPRWSRPSGTAAAHAPAPTRDRPDRRSRPSMVQGHRLSGGRRADLLPSRLPPHRRPQPDPRGICHENSRCRRPFEAPTPIRSAAGTAKVRARRAAHTGACAAGNDGPKRRERQGPEPVALAWDGAQRRATRRAPPTARGAPDGQRVDEDHA